MGTEPAFDKKQLRSHLLRLEPRRRLLFSLVCSERLYPNYAVFATNESWGRPAVIRATLDAAWEVVLGHPLARDEARKLQTAIEEATPDTEDFDTILVSSALDAAVATLYVLQLIGPDAVEREMEDDAELAAEVASLSIDTIDMYVQELEQWDSGDPDLEEKILHHPLMQTELQRQKTDLHVLVNMAWIPSKLKLARNEWRNPKRSNIDLTCPDNVAGG